MADDTQKQQPDVIGLFKGLPEDRQRAILGKLSPDRKQMLVSQLEARKSGGFKVPGLIAPPSFGTPAPAPVKKPKSLTDRYVQWTQQQSGKYAKGAQEEMGKVLGPESEGKSFLERLGHSALSTEYAADKTIYDIAGGLTPKNLGVMATGAIHPAIPAAYFGASGILDFPKATSEAIKNPSPDNVEKVLLLGAQITGSAAALSDVSGTSIGENLRTRAAKLDTKALKPEDLSKGAGQAMAANRIWGMKRSLPGMIRKVINQRVAQTNQMAQAADAQGIRLDVKQELDDAMSAAKERPAFMGDRQALNDLDNWRAKLSNQIDPTTRQSTPRNWSGLKPSDGLTLTRGLEKDAGWEGSPKAHIEHAARLFRAGINRELDTKVPGVGALRKESAGLIEAEKSAKALAEKAEKEQGGMFASIWRASSIPKLAMGMIALQALKELGLPYIGAAGALIGLRGVAESIVSRTGRAALYDWASDIFMGKRTPVGARANPRGGQTPTAPPAGPPAAPNAPQGPLPAPMPTPQGGPQVTVPQGVTGAPQAGPPVAPKTALGLPSGEPPLETEMRLGTQTPPESTKPKALESKLGTPEEQARVSRSMEGRSVKKQALEPKGRPGAKTDTKALMDRLDDLYTRLDNPKSPADRAGIQRGIDEIKAMIQGKGTPEELAHMKEKMQTRERVQAYRAREAAKVPVEAGATAPGGHEVAEGVSRQASPEHAMIALETAYNQINNFTAEDINGPELVKALKKQAKDMDVNMQLDAALEVLEFLKNKKF